MSSALSSTYGCQTKGQCRELKESWEDDDEAYCRPLLQVCHSSPTTPEPMPRLLTPPPDIGWHTPSLPGVNALLDTAWHRRTASAPEHNRRYSMAASLPAPPANVTGLIPPQRLLSPFDPNRLMPRLERELPAPPMAYANYSPSFVGMTPPSTLPSYSPIMTTKTPPMLQRHAARRPTTGSCIFCAGLEHTTYLGDATASTTTHFDARPYFCSRSAQPRRPLL